MLKIFPDPSLKQSASSQELPTLDICISMLKVMEEAEGVAIAANQIGLPGRFWVMRTWSGPTTVSCIANATVTLLGPFRAISEGCLSLPTQFSMVKRSEKVYVKGLRANVYKTGEPLIFSPFEETWTGLNAQIAQHENDHLDGKVFIDHLASAERSRIKGNLAKLKRGGKI